MSFSTSINALPPNMWVWLELPMRGLKKSEWTDTLKNVSVVNDSWVMPKQRGEAPWISLADRKAILSRQTSLLHYARCSPSEAQAKFSQIAPSSLGLDQNLGFTNGFDYWYVEYLQESARGLREGTLTSQTLRDEGQLESLLPFLLLTKDWRALAAYFAGLRAYDATLVLMFRAARSAMFLAYVKRIAKASPQSRIPIRSVPRPRPPAAPLAPPTFQGLA